MESEPQASHRDWVAQNPSKVLGIILGIYVVLGALYAVLTPSWQVSDEPAHYNYVRHVAETGRLPILRIGELDVEYLKDLRTWGFPPNLSIDELQYESHQPPLYYLLAAGVYRVLLALGVSMPLGLRLFSLLLGAAAILVGYKLVMAIFPNDSLPALGTAAFAATLPMHLAISASVDNGALVRLILNLAVWLLVVIGQAGWDIRRSLMLGALWGLGVLSGFPAHVIPGLALVALVWDLVRSRRERRPASPWRSLGYAAVVVATALVIALPWLWHNVRAYGPTDPLGINRHAQVVAALARASERPASEGWFAWLRDISTIGFQSFWGEFGWMSVPLSPGIYKVLGLTSLLVVIHLALHVLDITRGRVPVAPEAPRALALLALWAFLALLGYVWLNLVVPFPQGRHLFPAMVVWGLGCTLGLRKLFQSSPLPILALLAASIVLLFALSIATGNFRGFGIMALALSMITIGLGHWLHSRTPSTPLVVTYAGLAILAIVSLFRYIIPSLAALAP